MHSIRFPLLLLILILPIIQGCGGLLVGGTAATGISVVHDRRSTGTLVEDQEIELRFFHFKQKHPDFTDQSDVTCTSFNRRVLLTGSATSQTVANRAIQFVRNLPGVRLVINEIEIHPQGDFKEILNDSYINTQVKLALFKIKLPDFDPTRVKAVTYNGSVYLLGLVSSAEGQAAAEKARYVKDVKRVVKHFEYINYVPQAKTQPAPPATDNAFLQ